MDVHYVNQAKKCHLCSLLCQILLLLPCQIWSLGEITASQKGLFLMPQKLHALGPLLLSPEYYCIIPHARVELVTALLYKCVVVAPGTNLLAIVISILQGGFWAREAPIGEHGEWCSEEFVRVDGY